jgi:hypothetical protein
MDFRKSVVSNLPSTLYAVAQKVVDKTKDLSSSDSMKGIVSTIQMNVGNFAARISDQVGLREHFRILIETGECSNRFFAGFRWVVSNIPVIGPLLAGGDCRRTPEVYEKVLSAATGSQPSGSSEAAIGDVAAADGPQPGKEILRNAKTIWCQGFDGKQFTLLVDGTHEVKVGNLGEFRDCRLEEFSIDNFQGTGLDLSQISAGKITIASCPNLQRISGLAGQVGVANCEVLETATGGPLLKSFQAEGCQKLNALDFSSSVMLHTIDLTANKIPEHITLPAGTPDYVLQSLRADRTVNW